MKITKDMISTSCLAFSDQDISDVFGDKDHILVQDIPNLSIPMAAQIELLIELMPKQNQRLFAIDCYNTLPRLRTYRESDKAVLIARAHAFGSRTNNYLSYVRDMCIIKNDGIICSGSLFFK